MRKSLNSKGLTLLQLLVVLVLIGIVSSITVMGVVTFQERARITVLEQSQVVIQRNIHYFTVTDDLSEDNRNALRDQLIEMGTAFSNPYTGDTRIISTTQVGSASSAAVVIAQRTTSTVNACLNNPNSNLWPFNSTSQAVKDRFIGAIVIQICSDGYLMFAYTKDKALHNPIIIPFSD